MIPWLLATARADVAFEAPPERGAETVIVVTDAGETVGGATVRVVTRPGLAGSREIAVGITDGHGRVKWTPETPGLTVVRAGDEQVRVHVAGAAPPATALTLGVLSAAALALLAVGAWPRRR